MSFKYSSFSDRGPHPENQDSFSASAGNGYCVACVADGVGGASRGQEASLYATARFSSELAATPEESLGSLVTAINKELIDKGEGLVTTFTGVVLRGMHLFAVHAGDTRVCVLRGNGIKQLSEDHTEFFRFYSEGRLSAADAETYPRKHILENALGVKAEPRVDVFEFPLQVGDRVLLTTDGVHSLISKQTLRDLSKEHSDVSDFVASIYSLINNKQPTDNFTAVAIQVEAS